MTDGDTEPLVSSGEVADETDSTDPLSVSETSALANDLIENIETVIVGKHDVIEHLVTAILGRGHVLLDDVPGVGKTMLARSVARSVDGEFSRIQFTPDLLPTDVTGVNVYNERAGEFEFQPGPVFGNVVLGDEINRAPPKTQSALLEAMEEGQVTTDGVTRPVPDPFVVVATQNAIERERTYELPIAEIDRFTKRLELGYPTPEDEEEVLRRAVGDHPIDAVEPVATTRDLRRARRTATNVTVGEPIRQYVTSLVNYTRSHAALGVSPRGGISLLNAAQGRALLDDRDYVVPDDVKAEARAVLPHRIRADNGSSLGGENARALVGKALERVTAE